MIILLLSALLLHPTLGVFTNSPIVHLADILRLKCDSLLYRSFFDGNRCYFAVAKEAKLSDATYQCSVIFPGAKIALGGSAEMFNSLRLDMSRFHFGDDSSGAKEFICVYDSGYKCDKGNQSTVMPGICVLPLEQKTGLPTSMLYCSVKGMRVPSIGNDLENKMIRAEVRSGYTWVWNMYSNELLNGRWYREKYFSRYETCIRPKIHYAGSQMKQVCKRLEIGSMIDKNGYWGNVHKHTAVDAICVKPAANEFTGKERCAEEHRLDPETGLCEWTGPKNACVKMIHVNNKTMFMHLSTMAARKYEQIDLYKYNNGFNDKVVKMIIRRGCCAVVNSANAGSPAYLHMKLMIDAISYGEHHVPNAFDKTVTYQSDGATVIGCSCVPPLKNIKP